MVMVTVIRTSSYNEASWGTLDSAGVPEGAQIRFEFEYSRVTANRRLAYESAACATATRPVYNL